MACYGRRARPAPIGSPAIDQRTLDPVLTAGRCLLAVAAPGEATAVLRGLGFDPSQVPAPWSSISLNERLGLLVTGVGKANAAGAVARAGGDGWSGVLAIGIAGALPGERAPGVGQKALADACILADEGLGLADGFVPQSRMGFPAVEGVGERFESDPAWVDALRPVADVVGACATVSTCSGTDAAAAEIARRTGAVCEDMESAAAALAASRLGLPFACLRVISNRTGDRDRQGWDLDGAFSALARLVAML